MLFASIGNHLCTVALGNHNHGTSMILEFINIRVHTIGRCRAHTAAWQSLWSLGRTCIQHWIILEILWQLLSLVQTGFEAGMSYIAGHNDGTIQADAGSYRIFGKFLADLCTRMVQIYLHGISLTGIAQLCWYQTGRIVIHFLNPDTFLVDFSLDVTVG